MAVRTTDPWLPFRKAGGEHRLRLFCFANAGGGASVFRPWTVDGLPPAVEVCPVQLPGRENRLREKPFVRVEPLADTLTEVLAPHLDLPFAFFGHSMGSIVAFEVCQRLRQAGAAQPRLLLATGRRAPHLPDDDPPIYQLPDEELIERLKDYEGTPQAVLEHQELMALVLPILRADFELVETYRYRERPALDCPIAAWGGVEDPDVPRDSLEAWAAVTNAACRARLFPGGHFFLHEDRPRLLAALSEELAALVAAGGR